MLLDYVYSTTLCIMESCGGEQLVCVAADPSTCAPWVISLMSVPLMTCRRCQMCQLITQTPFGWWSVETVVLLVRSTLQNLILLPSANI